MEELVLTGACDIVKKIPFHIHLDRGRTLSQNRPTLPNKQPFQKPPILPDPIAPDMNFWL
jgi:hypothetical protein